MYKDPAGSQPTTPAERAASQKAPSIGSGRLGRKQPGPQSMHKGQLSGAVTGPATEHAGPCCIPSAGHMPRLSLCRRMYTVQGQETRSRQQPRLDACHQAAGLPPIYLRAQSNLRHIPHLHTAVTNRVSLQQSSPKTSRHGKWRLTGLSSRTRQPRRMIH